MKIKLFALFVMLTLVSLGISSCAAPAAQPPAPATTSEPVAPTLDPAEQPEAKVVLDMVAKLNAGDIDGSLAFFAEDAMSYFIGMPPTGMEVYWGREGLRPVYEFSVAQNFKWDTEIVSVEDNIVTAKTKTTMDFTEELGVAPNDFVDYYLVENGKIANYASVMTEESLAEFKPALLAVMPIEPTEPPADDPASELAVTFANGTCTTPGPLVLKAGELKVSVVVEDASQEKYALGLFTLAEGKDMVDLMSSTLRPSPPDWSEMFFLKEYVPGQTEIYTVDIKDKPVYLVCFAYPFELPNGNVGPFEVKP